MKTKMKLLLIKEYINNFLWKYYARFIIQLNIAVSQQINSKISMIPVITHKSLIR